ncbi:hypothetical protein [Niveispirillum irakense]|uniref:hypothetical protein n=1 Tax=Niveispirillum irakense TaxID=34011 RepID=UPI00040A2FCB|nr:hypothetical protein [Niveispirillum irakense]
MAFLPKDLSVLTYANGFTLWHYTTADTAASTANAGYFNAASHLLRVGDMILANSGTGGARASRILVVASNAAGDVGIGGLTA